MDLLFFAYTCVTRQICHHTGRTARSHLFDLDNFIKLELSQFTIVIIRSYFHCTTVTI